MLHTVLLRHGDHTLSGSRRGTLQAGWRAEERLLAAAGRAVCWVPRGSAIQCLATLLAAATREATLFSLFVGLFFFFNILTGSNKACISQGDNVGERVV